MSDLPHRNPVEELADQFVARYRRGERPSIAEYARQYPEHAAEIEELFPALVMMEQVDSDLKHAAEADAPAADPVPALTQLGDFRIIREVGRGGMGVVYEAEQVSLGRRVALKVLPKQVLLDSRHAKRFEREARAAAKLHHTNIVPVFGVGQQDGLHYYVMQFIHGLGLDEVLVELKQLREQSTPASGGRKPTEPAPVGVQVLACVRQPEGWTPTHNDVSAVGVAQSLLSGQFERTLIVESGEESAVSGQPSAVSGQPATQAESKIQNRKSKSASPFTTVAHLSDTFPLPGQSEHASKAHSRSVYWQSVARIGVQAAEALQYAHDQGVIHRDVKPGNLLLDTRGCVWVTDFGLAKATDQQDLTHTGDVLGTLRYMAPEQLDGNADARSDVYALGLTLYELLALQPGFDEADRRKLIKQVTTDAPVRLRLVEPRIPRDLETIVHKAIEREAAQRYATARDLAADLQRFLGDEPIRARRISPVTRFTRWCKRNPVVAGLTSAIAVLITTAAVVASIAAVRFEKLAENLQAALGDAKQNLTLADSETKRAEAALLQVKDEQQRAEGNLDLALTALDAVYLDAIGTEKLMGKQRTRPQAGETGFSPSASAPLTDLEKELLKRGLTFYDQFAQQNSSTPRAAVQTAQAHFRVGLLQGALGDDAAAESAYRAAIERFEALIKEEPMNVEYHRRLAQSYSGLSSTISDWDTAKPFVERSVESYTKAIQSSPDDAELYAARAWENMSVGRPVEQRHDLIKAADLAPDNLEHQLAAATVHHWGDPARGRRFAERAFQLDPESSGAALAMAFAFPAVDPEHLKYLTLAIERDPKSGWNWLRRAQAHIWRGENELALADAQKAVELAPNNVLALTVLGTALVNLKRHAEAEQSLNRALDINPHFWITVAALGDLRIGQQQFDQAVQVLSHAIELNPPEHWLYKRRAVALFSLGRFPGALADLTQALTLLPKDTSTLVCLGPTDIARCPDEAFKEGILKLADTAVENAEQPNRGRRERIALNLACGRYDQARRDLESLLIAENQNYTDHYQHALLSLQIEDEATYKTSCRTMLERFVQSDDPQAANFGAWTCALVPQALDDYTPAVTLASKAVAAQPDDAQFLTTFGAALYRAGRHAEALEQLSKLPDPQGTADADSRNSPAYAWYFLAMTHHALGDADQARAVMAKADSWTDAAFADSTNPPAWNRALTLKLLRAEAHALIGPGSTDDAAGVRDDGGQPAPPHSERKHESENDSAK